MTIEMIDGVRVLKLRDAHLPGEAHAEADLTMLHLWRLLTGGHMMRDVTACERHRF